MHKLLLVDDHQLVLDGLKSIFAQATDMEIVHAVNSAEEALRYLENVSIDLLITDVDMPGMSGVELAAEVRKRKLDVKVMILTMHNEKSIIKEIVKIGADGYMLKTANQAEMIAAARSVIRGEKIFSPDVTLALLKEETAPTADDFDLTEREKEILQLIAEGFSNKEIGEKLFISHRTVDTHRTNMMKKLDVKNIAGLIRFAIKNDLIK